MWARVLTSDGKSAKMSALRRPHAPVKARKCRNPCLHSHCFCIYLFVVRDSTLDMDKNYPSIMLLLAFLHSIRQKTYYENLQNFLY